MIRMKSGLLVGAVALFSASAVQAANTGPGLVTNLYVQNGVVVFQVSGNVAGSWPACAVTQRYAIDVTTAAGQAYYSAVLSAKMAGKPILVFGNGSCTNWGDSESISYVQIIP